MTFASKKRSSVFVFFSAVAGMMFSLAGLPVSVFSQQATFKRISIEEGLSQSAVHCLLQDKLGFIWLGTQDGLNRYDGYGFKIFRHDPQDSLSISDNWIQTIYEDRNGKLWIGTDGDGLNCYDRQSQSFVRYSPRKGKPGSLPHGRVWAISEDARGKLWVGTIGGGLAMLNQTTHAFTIYDTSNTSLASNEIMSLRATQDGKLWVGTFGGGLYRMDPQTMQMQVYRHDSRNASSLADDRIRTIIEDQYGTLWIGTYNGLSILDRSDQEQGRFRSVQDSVLTSRAVFALTENTDQTVWVGTFGSGIRTIDRTGRIVSSYKYDAKDATSLGDNSLYAFFCDRSGRMWIGTYSGGVNVFDTRKKDFRSMRHDPHNSASISDNRVRSIWKDTDGTMWLGTFKGLNRLDSRTGSIFVFTSEPSAASSLPENRIRIIRRDTKGRLWIGTSAAGLAVMDSLTNKITIYKHDPSSENSLPNNGVWSIAEDAQGTMWFGTTGGGFCRFDEKKKNFERVQPALGEPGYFSNDPVLALHTGRDGKLWIGTAGGLKSFAPTERRFIDLDFATNTPRSSSHSRNRVRSIYEDHDGVLWVGTDVGLQRWDPDSSTLRLYNHRQGLISDVIYGILEDTQRRLWLSTNYGIARFDPQSESFRNYDMTDGLANNEYNQNAYFRSHDGWFYFGGINGLDYFHPDSIKDNTDKFAVVITGLELFNQTVEVGKSYNGFILPKAISELEELVLSYRESVIGLKFSALTFTQPEKNRYAYKMEGFDEDWNYIDAGRRIATYTNLDPGTYRFQVRATNHDGIWNENTCVLTIRITPPWWQSWWAYAVYTGLVVLSLMLFVRIRIQNERKRHELEKARELAKINQELNDTIVRLRDTQAQLVQSEKMASLGQMTAGIAHEINNPLTFVYGNFEGLKDSVEKMRRRYAAGGDTLESTALPSPSETHGWMHELLEQINNGITGSRRIRDIVENLRKFARIGESGYKETDINADLLRIIDLFVKQHNDIRIDTSLGEDCIAHVNASEMNQVFFNVLTNAVQAIREAETQAVIRSGSGVISVQTTSALAHDQAWISIVITDNGVGIAPDDLKKIFDPFFTTRPVGQGRGLGLSEAYGIVHKHGGHIDVSSETGKGTTMRTVLPKGHHPV
ncbi:ATP-binding protein [bacterium]|nr:ATP-binding protein [bacterium]NUN45111.1 hypothetical protein [bacterium]